MVTAQNSAMTSKQLHHKLQSVRRSRSESVNIYYIYQAFILLFTKHYIPLLLCISVHLSLSLSLVPHPVFLISGLSQRVGDVDFLLQSKVLSSYTHSPYSDHVHTDAVAPSGGYCLTETVVPSSDHYCIDIAVPFGSCHLVIIATLRQCCHLVIITALRK